MRGCWYGLHLIDLATFYEVQGQYATATPLYERAVAVLENAFGSCAPEVAAGLEDYAVVLRKLGEDTAAARAETRAQAIRGKERNGENDTCRKP